MGDSESQRAWNRALLGDGPSGMAGKLSAILTGTGGPSCFLLCSRTVEQPLGDVPTAIVPSGAGFGRGPVGAGALAKAVFLFLSDIDLSDRSPRA